MSTQARRPLEQSASPISAALRMPEGAASPREAEQSLQRIERRRPALLESVPKPDQADALRAATAELQRANVQILLLEFALRELSTPVLKVSRGLLLAPLIGQVDARRARRFTDQLLAAILESRARVAVIDITGVTGINAEEARHLEDAMAAARLLGARVILTGVSRRVAQTLVEIGMDGTQLHVCGDLQSGLEEAYRLTSGPPSNRLE